MELSLTFNDTEVTKKLGTLAAGLKDFSEPFDHAGGDLLNFFGNTVFESQGREAGEAWQPLAATTLYMRSRRIGYYKQTPITTGKILIWTGRLMKGFEKAVTTTTLIIRNGVDYFKYHQQSQRKMLTINSKVITIVVARVSDYAAKILSR